MAHFYRRQTPHNIAFQHGLRVDKTCSNNGVEGSSVILGAVLRPVFVVSLSPVVHMLNVPEISL